MPRRRTTRTQDRARRINDEREANRTAIEEEREVQSVAAVADLESDEGEPSEDALSQSDAPF
jgi:hypothetical protein